MKYSFGEFTLDTAGLELRSQGMPVSINRFTSVDEVTDVGRAPLNSISHTHRFPTPDDKIIVRPNADTFYSSGW